MLSIHNSHHFHSHLCLCYSLKINENNKKINKIIRNNNDDHKILKKKISPFLVDLLTYCLMLNA